MSRRKESFASNQARDRRVVRRVRGAGEVEAEVVHRAHERVALEQRPVLLQRPGQVLGPVGLAEPRPGDEVGGRGDRRGRVDLQEGEVPHGLEQVGRPPRVEQLRADRDAPGFVSGQPVGRHDSGGYASWSAGQKTMPSYSSAQPWQTSSFTRCSIENRFPQ